MRNQRRRYAKAVRRCGGVRITAAQKGDGALIIEYRHRLAAGTLPGHSCR